ncbi:hypothetical protein C1Y40_04156 [Mycobacterium talmoniae]|uniref:Helix-turn-helix domain-containing protein n=1 Tax=Mycobacterium talmoniae TaxID=1858794 RepID=A0A2S8BGB8_9MYCO|nr:hypothetical protein C1Y40_04156 [Mycobacterium talmoniae]
MSANAPVEPLGDATQVAEFLGISPVTLAQWRQQGRGPRWARVGRWIRYDWADVRAWVQAGGDRDDA